MTPERQEEIQHRHDTDEAGNLADVFYEAARAEQAHLDRGELLAYVKQLKTHIQLHAGDCLSLNNEVELMRSHWLEAEARVKQLEAERAWQPIETAPKGRAVLVWKANTQEQYTAAYISGAHGPGWCSQDGCELFKVTHWMPLPSPPAEKGTV